MAKKQIPVVGEPFKEYVNNQIATRQKVYGSGFNQTRTAQEMSYLNSKTSWVKMASSVSVNSDDEGSNKMTKLQNSNGEGNSVKGKRGMSLAQSAVLHNTIYDYNKKSFNSGVSTNNTLLNNKSYGFGGTEFGINPSPGIKGFEVKHENRGSIRTATITITAYNKFQFELIETLYLRLGFTMMIEWGHSKYLKNNNSLTNPTSTLIDNYWWKENGVSHLNMLKEIEKQRELSNGNYDALFGKVVNFSWEFTTSGTYEISINLASLGDVVESFKINTLAPHLTYAPNSTTYVDEETNTNLISQILAIGKNEILFNSSEHYIKINEIEDIDDEPISKSVDPSNQHYVRFGEFNKLISQNIPHFDHCTPLFDFDISNDSLMAALPNLTSVNPRSFLIKPEFTKETHLKFEFEWSDKMAKFYSKNSTTKNTTGIINNIYLSFNLLDKLASSNSTKKGVLSFYAFYTSILDEINKGFANLCNLELTIDEDTNKAIIRDQNLQTRTDNDGSLLTTNSFPLEVYGFNNGQSNFVKNYSFQTQITNELKNILTIGATANNSIVNEDATIFSKWNKGLTDRYQQGGIDSKSPDCPTKNKDDKTQTKNSADGDSIFGILFSDLISQYKSQTGKNDLPKAGRPSLKIQSRRGKLKEKLKEELKKDEVLNVENWVAYLQFIFTDEASVPLTATTRAARNKSRYFKIDTTTYFRSNPKVVERGFQSLRNRYITKNRKTFEDDNQPSSNIGFIPIELSLEVDGLSGIKIYNQLVINSKFLPPNYGDTMEFVVMGVDHKLETNNWTTNIRAIAKPKPITYTKINQSLTMMGA